MKMCSATHRVGIVHCHPIGIFILAIKESALSIAGKNKKKALIGQITTLFPILLPSPQKTKSNQTKKKKPKEQHMF